MGRVRVGPADDSDSAMPYNRARQEMLRARFERDANIVITCILCAGVVLLAYWIGR